MGRKERPLTERDVETLLEIDAATASSIAYQLSGWIKPMDLGGTDGSHHSYTLTKLAKRGLVDREEPFSLSMMRGSCRYRINDAGRAELRTRGLKKDD